jgi:hypothetical protein
MRVGLSRLSGPAAALVLILFSAACVMAVENQPGPVRMPPPPPPAPSPINDDYGVFYDRLEPYGDWAWLDPYGWVWAPWRVAAGWRPYTVGRWIYTDDGWYWESEESWGWATYHYGRWTFHPRYGWVWIPGREWAPAWVAWRHGDGWIGWAPLPPQAVWRAEIGIDFGGVDIDVIIQPFWWGFVEEGRFLDPRISVRIVPYARNVTLVRQTRHVSHYGYGWDRNRVVVRGVDVDDFERGGKHKVPRYQIVDDNRDEDRRGTLMGQEVRVYRPTVKEAPPSRAPRTSLPRESEQPSGGEQGRAVVTRPAPASPETRAETAAEQPVSRQASEELIRRQHAEQRDFEKRAADERSRLEQIQRKESRKAVAAPPADELQKRHEEELRAHQEGVTREQQVLEAKQERESKNPKKADATADESKKRTAHQKEKQDRKEK